MVVTCPECSTELDLTDTQAARGRVKCPECGDVISVARADPDLPTARRAKQAAGGEKTHSSVLGCLVLVAIVLGAGYYFSQKAKKAQQDVAEGDRLFERGQKSEAAAKYKDGYDHAPSDRKPELLRRIVESDVAAGNVAGAREWIERGLAENSSVTYEAPAARDLLTAIHRERAEAEARKKAEAERKRAEAEQRRIEAEEKAKGIPITAAQLRQEYQNNPTAADSKYKGNRLRITGVVQEYIGITPGERRPPFVVVALEPNAEPWVWCRFYPSEDAELRSLRPGQQVTIKGICDGIFVGEIRITLCTVER